MKNEPKAKQKRSIIVRLLCLFARSQDINLAFLLLLLADTPAFNEIGGRRSSPPKCFQMLTVFKKN